MTDKQVKSLTLLAMCLGLFMPQLDSTVVNLAIPSMQRSLHADIGQLQWVIDSYNLIFASLLLMGGTLGDLFGRKKLFLIGLVIFSLGSLLCGIAGNYVLLIGGRVLQGVGAALELPGTLAILSITYTDPRERAHAMGIWASVAGIAFAVGPTAGAFLVNVFGWQSIFFLNVPIGLLTLLLAMGVVRESANPQGRQLDLVGQMLAIVLMITLTYSVIESHAGWSSPQVAGSFGLAVCSLILLIIVERRTSGPMVPLDIFQRVPFSASLAIAGMMTFGMYGMFFLISLYLQTINHASPLIAGLEQLPLSLTFAVISPLAGRLVGRFGARRLIVAGMSLMGIGLLLMQMLVPGNSMLWFLLIVMCLIGVGLGCNMGPVLGVAMGSVEAARSGMASGLSNVARMVGATMGVAVLGAIMASHVARDNGSAAFMTGLHSAFLVGGCVELAGAVLAVLFIPRIVHSLGRAAHAEPIAAAAVVQEDGV